MSWILPTTREPAPIAKSVSVVAGVRETIFCGAALMVTFVPSSSVTVTGKAALAVGGAEVGTIDVARAPTVGPAVGVAVGAADEQPTARIAKAIRNRRRERGI